MKGKITKRGNKNDKIKREWKSLFNNIDKSFIQLNKANNM